jgi:hypothetical protein
MSATDAQQQVPWYAEGRLEPDNPWDHICAVMRDLADEWPEEAAAFAGFAHWVRSEALSQEVFGETIEAWPEVLTVAWHAFMAGRSPAYDTKTAPPSGAAGGVVTASHRVDPPAAGTAVPSSLPLPRTAPAGMSPAPAGVGPHAEVA